MTFCQSSFIFPDGYSNSINEGSIFRAFFVIFWGEKGVLRGLFHDNLCKVDLKTSLSRAK